MPTTPESVTALLAVHRQDRIGSGYPAPLRRRVGALVRGWEAAGSRITTLAATLGVSRTALRTWSKLADEVEDAGGFARVVIDDPAPILDETYSDYGIDLCTPDGFQLRGLTLDQSIRAVRALR